MQIHPLSPAEWAKALGIGAAVSVLTAAVMFVGLRSGISPLPQPLGLAFAETLLGRPLPLPVGMLFHLAWVTLWSAVYVVAFRDALSFAKALWLAAALWVLVLLFFFPIVGWGFFGLAVTPKLIVASVVPHFLFAVLLWGFARWAFGHSARARH